MRVGRGRSVTDDETNRSPASGAILRHPLCPLQRFALLLPSNLTANYRVGWGRGEGRDGRGETSRSLARKHQGNLSRLCAAAANQRFPAGGGDANNKC